MVCRLSTHSIYIQNTSGVHNDVVLDVAVNSNSDTENLNQKQRNIDSSSDTHFSSKEHVSKCFKQKQISDARPFPNKLSKYELNFNVQEEAVLSAGSLSTEHNASTSIKYLKKHKTLYTKKHMTFIQKVTKQTLNCSMTQCNTPQ